MIKLALPASLLQENGPPATALSFPACLHLGQCVELKNGALSKCARFDQSYVITLLETMVSGGGLSGLHRSL